MRCRFGVAAIGGLCLLLAGFAALTDMLLIADMDGLHE
jgi:hypothetical protein